MALGFVFITQTAYSSSSAQAMRIYQRIAGVPASKEVHDQMVTLIDQDKIVDAAKLALNDSNFLNVTVFDMFAPLTNEDEANRVELNDFLATIIGIVRDNVSFQEALLGDIIYLPPVDSTAASWSPSDNLMYQQHVQNNPIDFSSSLVKHTQSSVIGPVLGLDNTFRDYAGVMTTREFAVNFYFDGTNRAALNYALKGFICKDIEMLADSTRSDHRVRQDVERNPGNNSTTYRTQCVGCHAGMDALGGAFAYFDATLVEDKLTYSITPGEVHKKFVQNYLNYPEGLVTKDDSWVNLWSDGINKVLGWNGKQSGNGVQNFGRLIAESDAFSQCMARRVYSRTCMADWKKEEGDHISTLAKVFVDSNYNFKELFAKSATMCAGE